MQNQLFIPFNKNQTYILLIVSICLLALIFYVYVVRNESLFGNIGNTIAIIFLIICAIIVLTKLITDLFKKDCGLYFSSDGVKIKYDNKKEVNIPWQEISGIEIKPIHKTSFLLIYVYEPNKYDKFTNSRNQHYDEELSKYFGTPINLDLSLLNLNNKDINSEIDKYIDLYVFNRSN